MSKLVVCCRRYPQLLDVAMHEMVVAERENMQVAYCHFKSMCFTCAYTGCHSMQRLRSPPAFSKSMCFICAYTDTV